MTPLDPDQAPGNSRRSRPAGLLSVDDVCSYLGVSRYYVYDQVRLGRLRCARIARQLRFRLADIDAFVEQNLTDASPALYGLPPSDRARHRRAM